MATRRSPLSRAALRRAVSWHRRPLAALAAVLAVLATVAALSPEQAPGVTVVTAVRGLPGGAQLTADDLAVVEVDPVAAPESAPGSVEALLGRTLTAPVTKGTILTSVDVVAPRERGGGRGTVLAPVRLADAEVVGLLRVGDEVDVLGGDAATGAVGVVASSARVASLPSREEEGGLFAGGSGSGALVLLEVPPAAAVALTEASLGGSLSLVLT